MAAPLSPSLGRATSRIHVVKKKQTAPRHRAAVRLLPGEQASTSLKSATAPHTTRSH
jgi:hypothetical protein